MVERDRFTKKRGKKKERKIKKDEKTDRVREKEEK